MTTLIELKPLKEQSLDAQLMQLTGDGFGYSSFHNEGDTTKLTPSGILVHKKSGMRFKVPLPIFTLAEYNQQAQKDVWDTERTDWKDWPKIRHQFIGKRTFLGNENGATVLFIEDQHFVIEN
ncbi:hypothetical protein [Shewanella aestuarii]|uniref:Uncharacterized protein n=1 Tax=Shewanella aestuarii TaxID=1028752 RepID=A0A6G9QPD4_9GAMM|nr:hypothetical protein [Shewanella aestuarii]QIR16342.1 hypothetical protein HBH39_17810 [Shewanella aestuarii]